MASPRTHTCVGAVLASSVLASLPAQAVELNTGNPDVDARMQQHYHSNSSADAPYWSALAAGRLELPRCTRCERWEWPAVFRCGECGSWQHTWQVVEPAGTVFSYTRTRHRFARTASLELPYTIVVVELPQVAGRRLMGLLTGDETGLKIGARVRGEPAFTLVDDRPIPVLKWRLAQSAT